MDNIVSRESLINRFNRETKTLLSVAVFILGSLIAIPVIGGFSANSRRDVARPAMLSHGARMRANHLRAANPVRMYLPSAQNTPTPEPLVVEEFTLRPAGFYPSAIQRPKGKFLLAINNRAGIQEMNITISREIGNQKEKLKDVKVHKKYLDWNDVLDLQPGSYVVAEASNPKWICRITVTPK